MEEVKIIDCSSNAGIEIRRGIEWLLMISLNY